MREHLIRRLALVPPALAVVFLLAAAVPRLHASLAQLPVERAIDDHWNVEPLHARRIVPLLARARESIGHHPDARYYEALGFLHWRLGRDPDLPVSERRRHLFSASGLFRRSLARAPVQPYVWLRLARSELLADPAAEKRFNDALRMSILTARSDRNIVPDRLELGLRYFRKLDGETRKLLIDQMHVARELNPDDFRARVGRLRHHLARALVLTRDEHPQLVRSLEAALAPLD